MDEVQGGSNDNSIIGREARRREQEKKGSGGILGWFGKILGCGDKRSK